MSELVECPVDDCEYGPQPRKSVLGHYSGKSDGLHPGGYQKAKDLIPAASDTTAEPDPEPEPEPEPQPDTQPSETSTGTGGENPTFGSADPVSEPEPQPQPSEQPQAEQSPAESSGEPRCLDCEGELVDFRDVERGTYAEIANGKMHVKGDYLCSDCGQWWFDK